DDARPPVGGDRGASLFRRSFRAGGRRSVVDLAIDGDARVADCADVALSLHDQGPSEECAAMNGPSWERIKEVFQDALDRPAQERTAWLRDRCGSDRALQAEVEALLAAHDEAGSFAA